MRIVKTKFKDLLLYEKDTYKDKRGYFRELFIQKHFDEKFPFDVMSYSKKNVLRGLHLQLKNPQAKLITVLKGKIFDVCLDCRKNSKTFGKYFSIILSDKENKSLLIPKGFAHGFCTLSDNVVLHYKCSSYRSKNSEFGILWNDKKIKINWPIKKPVISEKDKKNFLFDDFIKMKLNF
jgi:dTDP-4-dehydrorhamnose 3,5-epimerase